MFRVRVIFYIISWVHQFNYSIYTLCLGLGLELGVRFFSPFFVTNTNGHPDKLSIMTSCILIFVSLSTCQPCRPCQLVYLSTLSTCLPCQPVNLVILSTLQPIYQFNIHNIIHYIGRINIKWIFKGKSPRTSFYRILDLSQFVNLLSFLSDR
jgi:hypothetical protein